MIFGKDAYDGMWWDVQRIYKKRLEIASEKVKAEAEKWDEKIQDLIEKEIQD